MKFLTVWPKYLAHSFSADQNISLETKSGFSDWLIVIDSRRELSLIGCKKSCEIR